MGAVAGTRVVVRVAVTEGVRGDGSEDGEAGGAFLKGRL